MHRVELKEALEEVLEKKLFPFLMHRVELKAQPEVARHFHPFKFLMHRVELKVPKKHLKLPLI